MEIRAKAVYVIIFGNNLVVWNDNGKWVLAVGIVYSVYSTGLSNFLGDILIGYCCVVGDLL